MDLAFGSAILENYTLTTPARHLDPKPVLMRLESAYKQAIEINISSVRQGYGAQYFSLLTKNIFE